MPSQGRLIVLAALALAGCGRGGGYRDAPTIDLPRGTALAPDAPRADPVVAPEQSAPPPDAYPSRPAMQPARDLPSEVAQGEGPRGTSGNVREDAIGYATVMSGPPDARWSSVAIGVAHPSLEGGTVVEVTALDTGRTIVAMVVSRDAGGGVVALSSGAAQALGVGDRAGVRVRTIAASPQDRIALQSGQSASARLDAPPTLLAALRKRLPGQQLPSSRGVAPVRNPASIASRPVRAPTRAPARTSGFVVQVAAVSSAERAAALARDLGGHVAASGGLYRVQIGPFADMAAAQRARDGAARRGYGDARIFRIE